jgi:hypothetical protein
VSAASLRAQASRMANLGNDLARSPDAMTIRHTLVTFCKAEAKRLEEEAAAVEVARPAPVSEQAG